MKRIILALLIGIPSFSSTVWSQAVMHLKILKVDPATAEIIRGAANSAKPPAADLDARLTQWRRENKISEVAEFTQALKPNPESYTFKKDTQEVRVADGEMMPTGLVLEIEPSVGYHGMVELRLAVQYSIPDRRNHIQQYKTSCSAIAMPEQWKVLTEWSSGADTLMLLARFTGIQLKAPTARDSLARNQFSCYSELLLTTAGDLKTFHRSTPATRAKAIEWLRKKGKIIHTGLLTSHNSHIAELQDCIWWIHETPQGWDTKDMGLKLRLYGQIDTLGKLIDLNVHGTWSDKDAKKPREAATFSYEFASTTGSGSTWMIESTQTSDSPFVPVLLVTPAIQVLHDTSASTAAGPESVPPGGLHSRSYPVHPSFERKMRELAGMKPLLAEGQNRVGVKDLMAPMGIEFPKGTSMAFNTSACEVLLTHHQEAHDGFQQLLKKHGLEPQANP